MIHTDTKILSLAAALLLCFGTYALAAPPEGKGKPSKGNQPVDATAVFSGDIISSGLVDGRLPGEFIDNGDFDTLKGQLVIGEFITIRGDAGEGLAALDLDYSILPTGATASCNGNCSVLFEVLHDDENSGVTWTIRLDRDKQPKNRVQFRMRWLNGAGLEHHLRIGWVVQAYGDEIYPLPDSEYGEVTKGDPSSLKSTTVTFDADFFRIDGKVLTGRGKKTEQEVFSQYGEQFLQPDDPEVDPTSPWCGMGGTATDPTC